GDPRSRRVLRGVDTRREKLLRASRRLRSLVDIERRVGAVVGLECRTGKRRRAARSALVDEHDVAVLAHSGQERRERPEEARRLTRAAGENKQWIGARIERVGRKHRYRKRDLAAVGLRAILGDFERAALRGERKLRQSALGERNGAPRRIALSAAGEPQHKRGDGGGESGCDHRGRWYQSARVAVESCDVDADARATCCGYTGLEPLFAAPLPS